MKIATKSTLTAFLKPPMVGNAWLPPYDSDVGTVHYLRSYMFHCEITLQVRVERNRIVDARCSVDDDTSKASGPELAQAIVTHLLDRTVGSALDINDTIFWTISLPREAIYEALEDWAGRDASRLVALPMRPHEAVSPGRWPFVRTVIRLLTGRPS